MVLKYQSPRRLGHRHDGPRPEPIFFEPKNEVVGATTFEEAKPPFGQWYAEKFSDSWSMKYNPDKDPRMTMPAAVQCATFVTHSVVMATPEEAQEYYKLKASLTQI